MSQTIKILKAVLKHRWRGHPVPLHASWITTNRCNLHCLYCDHPEITGAELDTGEALALIDALAEAGTIRLSLTGGEPLLRQDLPEIVRRAVSRGMIVGLNTNGMLLTDRPEALPAVHRVTMSLDGPPEIHDAIRGEGAFARLTRSVEIIRRRGIPLSFTTVVHRENAAVLSRVFDLFPEARIPILFQPASPRTKGSGCRANPKHLDPEPLSEAFAKLMGAKRQGLPVANSFSGLWRLQKHGRLLDLPCQGGGLFVRIDADGRLRRCGYTEPGPALLPLTPAGIREAMRQIPHSTCAACYSAIRVEFNLMMHGSLDAIRNARKA